MLSRLQIKFCLQNCLSLEIYVKTYSLINYEMKRIFFFFFYFQSNLFELQISQNLNLRILKRKKSNNTRSLVIIKSIRHDFDRLWCSNAELINVVRAG